MTIRRVDAEDDRATAEVALRTRQDEELGNGNSCSDWDLTYSLVRVQGTWLIADAEGSAEGC